MVRIRVPLVSLLLVSCLAFAAPAEERNEASLDVLVGAIQSDKEAFVAANLPLTQGEAQAFWPVYERYQKELGVVQHRFAALIEDYTANFRTMSDAKASELVSTYLDLERDRAEVRRKYLKPFAEVLPGRKVARLYQIENKIDAVLRYHLARDIPVVDEPNP
jgi:hypothetical protein